MEIQKYTQRKKLACYRCPQVISHDYHDFQQQKFEGFFWFCAPLIPVWYTSACSSVPKRLEMSNSANPMMYVVMIKINVP